jgi:hypothetical protein
VGSGACSDCAEVSLMCDMHREREREREREIHTYVHCSDCAQVSLMCVLPLQMPDFACIGG